MIVPKIAVAMVCGVSAFVGSIGSAYLIHEQYAKKHVTQEKNLSLLRDTKMRLEAVEEFGDKFNQAYPEIPVSPDLLTLYQSLEVSSIIPVLPDDVVITNVTNVVVGGERTPLYEICMGNAPDGLKITFSSMSQAIEQVRRIDNRDDLSYQTLKVFPGRQGMGVVLNLDALCFLGRVPMEADA